MAEKTVTTDAERIKILEDALAPFAKIKPSSFYPEDGSENEKYGVVLTRDLSDYDNGVTGEDLARARAAMWRVQ